MRGTGGVSPSVIRAVSSGAHPSNSAAMRAAVKSMRANQPWGLVSAT